MSINDATNVASATAASSISSVKKLTKSLSNNIFTKTLHQLRRKCYKNFYAKSYDQLPIDTICELNTEIIATYSGPDNGIGDVSLVSIRKQLQQQQKQQELNENSNKQTSLEKETNVLTNLENDTQTINENSNKLSEASNKNETILNEDNNNNNKNTNTADKQDVINEKALINECLDSFYKSNIKKWNVHHHRAYGIACSLYETNPVTKMNVGEPIADVFATITRRNSSILILADGVNWGPRSRLAARAAVRASMNYINRNLFFPINSQNDNFNNLQANNHSKYLTTHDLFRIMCRSFDAAQDFILQKKGTMTTLCCCMVVKLKDSSASASSSSMWAVCTLSIGDSTAYVFNRTKGIFELTYGARNLNDDRDMRNVGGALGHVYGIKPDVSNLNYSIMYIKENDIVFLVSDGVSDNLDPIVSQTARKRPPNDSSVSAFNAAPSINMCNKEVSSINASPSSDSVDSTTRKSPSKTTQTKGLLNESTDEKTIDLSSLPVMSPYERYVCSLAHMNEILLRNKTPNDTVSAQETCAILIEHVMKLTANKRQMLESGLLEASNLTNDEERLKYQAMLREKVQKLRGKLDHASIVAYEVGTF